METTNNVPEVVASSHIHGLSIADREKYNDEKKIIYIFKCSDVSVFEKMKQNTVEKFTEMDATMLYTFDMSRPDNEHPINPVKCSEFATKLGFDQGFWDKLYGGILCKSDKGIIIHAPSGYQYKILVAIQEIDKTCQDKFWSFNPDVINNRKIIHVYPNV